jgi:hypothetical protein
MELGSKSPIIFFRALLFAPPTFLQALTENTNIPPRVIHTKCEKKLERLSIIWMHPPFREQVQCITTRFWWWNFRPILTNKTFTLSYNLNHVSKILVHLNLLNKQINEVRGKVRERREKSLLKNIVKDFEEEIIEERIKGWILLTVECKRRRRRIVCVRNKV